MTGFPAGSLPVNLAYLAGLQQVVDRVEDTESHTMCQVCDTRVVWSQDRQQLHHFDPTIVGHRPRATKVGNGK